MYGIRLDKVYLSQYSDGRLTIVDGLQRITTIKQFMEDKLALCNMEYFTECNGFKYSELKGKIPLLQFRKFRQTQIMCFVIDYRSPVMLKYDLFRRLNTGGKALNDQEIRNCIFKGNFNDLIKRLAKDERLHNLTKKPTSADNNGTYEELVLRFFAYLYNRDLFVHNVKDYLNAFMKWASVNYNEREYEQIFNRVLDELSGLEHGIVKNIGRKNTSTVFWEAITVGAAEALRNGVEHLNLDGFYDWVADELFNKLITGATNSRQMIDNRIEYTRNKFSRAHV